MFLYHKNKKNTFWDIDKLTQWTHVRDWSEQLLKPRPFPHFFSACNNIEIGDVIPCTVASGRGQGHCLTFLQLRTTVRGAEPQLAGVLERSGGLPAR